MLWLPNGQCSNTIYGLAAASRDLDLPGFGMALYRDGIVWIYTVALGRRSLIQSKGPTRQSKAESWQRMALKRFTKAMCDQSRSGYGIAKKCELCIAQARHGSVALGEGTAFIRAAAATHLSAYLSSHYSLFI